MTIRWGHGLFRTWLLAAVLWIGFSGWAEMRPMLVAAPKGLVTDPELLKKLNAGLDVSKMSDDELKAAYEAGKPKASVSTPNIAMVGTVFGPPLFVLIFGCALWWVLRGFRPQEK